VRKFREKETKKEWLKKGTQWKRRDQRQEESTKKKRKSNSCKILLSLPWACDCSPTLRHSNGPIREWQLPPLY